MKTLDSLKLNDKAYIRKLNVENKIKLRLLDLGFVENSTIKCIYTSPSKNPKAYLIMGSVIALRNEDAKNIIIEGDGIGSD